MAVPLCRSVSAVPGGWRADYRSRPAAADLRAVVASAWTGRSGRAFRMRLFPDGCADLVWDGRELVVLAPAPVARRATVSPSTPTDGLRLRPGALGGLFGIDASALGVAPVRVEDVLGPLAGHVEHELSATGPAPDRLALLENVARRLLAGGHVPDPRTLRAARLLGVPGARAEAVADRVGVSVRQLRRDVRAGAGLGPHDLGAVLRFARFVGGLQADGVDLAGAAVDAGYADQSHLGREVRRRAGATPGLLLATARRANGRLRPATRPPRATSG